MYGDSPPAIVLVGHRLQLLSTIILLSSRFICWAWTIWGKEIEHIAEGQTVEKHLLIIRKLKLTINLQCLANNFKYNIIEDLEFPPMDDK